MLSINKTQDRILCTDETGAHLEQGSAGADDAAVIQRALDRLKEGGELRLGAGTYTLRMPIGVHLPVMITGEGRGTELTPPPGDFAFKVHYDGRSPDRALSSFGVPPAHADPDMTWEKRRSIKGIETQLRHHGVHVRSLAIQGHGTGKGIYLATLTESTIRDLWIMNTGDGAGLFLQEKVMECVFENIHISNCGSPVSEALARKIPSE